MQENKDKATNRYSSDIRGYGGLRDLVIHYLGGVCEYCGSDKNLALHHKQPLYAGGYNTMYNLAIACRSCHHKLHVELRQLYPHERANGKKITKERLKVGKVTAQMLATMILMDVNGSTRREIAKEVGVGISTVSTKLKLGDRT